MTIVYLRKVVGPLVRSKVISTLAIIPSVLLLLSCSSQNSIVETNPTLLFEEDFEQYPTTYQNYSLASVKRDFGEIGSRASGEIRGFDGVDKVWPAQTLVGNGHLSAEYPADIASGRESGFLFDKRFADMDSATMEYRLKFGSAFFWAAGGKLPGLGGAANGAGIPVGCTKNQNNIKNGFSTRLMWRRNGQLVVYTYFPDRNTKKCGVDIAFFRVKPDQWYRITQTIELNTPGKRDGRIFMFVDDELVYQQDNVLFREVDKKEVKINTAIFHTYRGGGKLDTRFHSPKTERVLFDDIKIWRGRRPDLVYQ